MTSNLENQITSVISNSAADIVAMIVNEGAILCRPSNSQPDKPASWCLTRLRYPYDQPRTPAIAEMCLRLAATICATENGQPLDIDAPSENDIDVKITTVNAARVRGAIRRDEKSAQRRADATKRREAAISRARAENMAKWDRERELEQKQREDARNARLANRVPVYGNTYPVKDRLRTECGATWDGIKNLWMVTEDKLSEARAIVAGSVAVAGNSPRRLGQLWEECRHCGSEPVYMWSDGSTHCGCQL